MTLTMPMTGQPIMVTIQPWLAQKSSVGTQFAARYQADTDKAICVQHAETGETLWIPRSALLRMEAITEIAEPEYLINPPDIPITRMDIPPWRHQKQAFWFGKEKRGVYQSLWMGCGKTRVTIDLIQNRGHRRVLIACPRAVIDTWPEEFATWGVVDYSVLPLKSGSVTERAKRARAFVNSMAERDLPCAVVINYEAAWQGTFGPWAMNAGWDCVVCDELHRLKAAAGKASRWFGNLGRITPWRIGMSGTPMPHSPLDIYAQARFLAPRVFGTSHTVFKSRYAVMGGFNGKVVVGLQHMDELHQKFYSFAFRVGKEVLTLPPITTVTRTFPLSASVRALYDQLEEAFYAEVKSGEVTITNALTKIIRLQQITSGYLKLDDGRVECVSDEKETALREVLEDIAPDEPIAIVARYHYDLDTIKRVLNESGRSCAELSGRVDQLQAWKDGQFHSIAIQEASGDAGVTVVRSCYMIYYSLDHSLGRYQQVQERIHRPGQTRHVTYIHLVAEKTIDGAISTALKEKLDVVESVLRLKDTTTCP